MKYNFQWITTCKLKKNLPIYHFYRSLKHLQLEQLHSLQRRAESGPETPAANDLQQIYRVIEQTPDPEQTHPNSTNNPTNELLNYTNFHEGEYFRRSSYLIFNQLTTEFDRQQIVTPFF
jgi:hypothetical protein